MTDIEKCKIGEVCFKLYNISQSCFKNKSIYFTPSARPFDDMYDISNSNMYKYHLMLLKKANLFIKKITIDSNYISPAVIGKFCKNLEQVTLLGNDTKYLDFMLNYLLFRNKKITFLKLVDCKLDGSFFNSLLAGQITSLEFTDLSLSTPRLLYNFITHCINLKNLKIKKCNDNIYEQIHECCDKYILNITQLELNYSNLYNDHLKISNIIKSLKKLKILFLESENLEQQILESIISNTNIKCLKLNYEIMNINIFQTNYINFLNLEELQIFGSLSDEHFLIISSFMNLKSLTISQIFNIHLSYMCMKYVSKLNKLEKLSIGIITINEAYIEHICSIKSLKELFILSGNYLTDINISDILNNISLEKFHIYCIYNLTEFVISKLLYIKEFKIFWCNNVEDIGFIQLLTNCPYLNELTISNCEKISKNILYVLYNTILFRHKNVLEIDISGIKFNDLNLYCTKYLKLKN